MRPSAQRCLPYPGNTLPDPWRISRRQRCSTFGFTSNARATSPIELPRSSRCTAASLNSLVNILFDNPMTHSPFQWILSLNWLCQKWGQVHNDALARFNKDYYVVAVTRIQSNASQGVFGKTKLSGHWSPEPEEPQPVL